MPVVWFGVRPRGEAPGYTGLLVIIVRYGEIASLYMFLGSTALIAAPQALIDSALKPCDCSLSRRRAQDSY